MRKLTLTLLTAALACWVIGCTARSEPAPQPAPAPTPAPAAPAPTPAEAHRLESWLQTSPLKQDMRSMWLSLGLVASNAGGFRDTDLDALESNAQNIARTAGKFAEMWEVIRNANRMIALKAREKNWDEARRQSQRVYKACSDCHVDTWSPYTRGVMPGTVDAWLANGNAAENVEFGNLRLTTTPEYLHVMIRMVAYLDRAIGGIDNTNEADVLRWTKSMDEAVTEHYELWRTVERNAQLIVNDAASSQTQNVEGFYTRVSAACITCHEKYVKDERKPLNPLPWKSRR